MKFSLKTFLPLAAGLFFVCSQAFSQNTPTADGYAAAPDEWLLVKKGNPWWYETKPYACATSGANTYRGRANHH
jgi:hypothetical protein